MILTFEQQQSIKPISENNIGKWEQIAKEVNEVSMYSLFGIDFMLDVEGNLTNTDYSDLLNGSSYVINGVTYIHGGLRKILSYLIYAQYIKQTGIEDTFTGMVRQLRPETEKAQPGEKENLVKNTYKVAYTNADRTKHYLDCYASFPKWKTTPIKERVSTPKFITYKKK